MYYFTSDVFISSYQGNIMPIKTSSVNNLLKMNIKTHDTFTLDFRIFRTFCKVLSSNCKIVLFKITVKNKYFQMTFSFKRMKTYRYP